jgi:hypothetical protein
VSELSVREEDVVMTLLESLQASYEYLITALKTMLMKELTIEYVMACLMHKLSKRKEKEPQGGKNGNGVVSKQSGRAMFAVRRKNVLLLSQTGPHCEVLLQNEEQEEGECQQYEGRGRICICNATQSAFDEHLQMDFA